MSPRSFAGTTSVPSPSTVAGTVVRSESSMSVASSSSRPSAARMPTPPSTWTVPRDDAARERAQPGRELVAIDGDADAGADPVSVSIMSFLNLS